MIGPGTVVLDRYRVVERIAVGGMSEIFTAHNPESEVVVVKALLTLPGEEPVDTEHFLSEARLTAHLSHPNIVRVLASGRHVDRPVIVMEYVDGGSLDALLRCIAREGKQVPLGVAFRILYDIARGLDYAHRATNAAGRPMRIVHRDVTPHNIMIDNQGRTQVLDFGIALASIRQERTASGIVKGKLRYMSPEQASGGEVDARSDQFSLGAVAWEMFTGEKLIKSQHDAAAVLALLTKPIPKPSEVRPAITPAIDDLVGRMLARDPSQRFASCDEVADAVQRIAKENAIGLDENVVGQFVRKNLGKRKLVHPTSPAAWAESERVPTSDLPERRRQQTTGSIEPPGPPRGTIELPILAPPPPRRFPWITVGVGAVVVFGLALVVRSLTTGPAAASCGDGVTAAVESCDAPSSLICNRCRFVSVRANAASEATGDAKLGAVSPSGFYVAFGREASEEGEPGGAYVYDVGARQLTLVGTLAEIGSILAISDTGDVFVSLLGNQILRFDSREKTLRKLGSTAQRDPAAVASDARGATVVFLDVSGALSVYEEGRGVSRIQTARGTVKAPLSLSADGNVVVYVRRNTGALHDEVMAYDRSSNQRHLVSANSAGAPAAGDVSDARVDSSGRYVFFRSNAPNLGVTDGALAGFFHDLGSGRTEVLPRAETAYPANGAESVLFCSDGHAAHWDRTKDRLRTLAIDEATPRPQGLGACRLSADGSTVVFEATDDRLKGSDAEGVDVYALRILPAAL